VIERRKIIANFGHCRASSDVLAWFSPACVGAARNRKQPVHITPGGAVEPSLARRWFGWQTDEATAEVWLCIGLRYGGPGLYGFRYLKSHNEGVVKTTVEITGR
jgi:hypothetical protein